VLSAYFELRAPVRLSSCAREPRTAATAILRIEVLAAEPFAKPLSVRGTGETENAVRDMVPPHRVPREQSESPRQNSRRIWWLLPMI
jgi:hypothetical protein